MRRILCVATVTMVMLLASGCNAERRRVSMEMNEMTAAYAIQMDKGKTTPDQDKRFIKALSKASLEMDSSIRGTSAAQQSRNNAINASTLGVDQNAVPTIK